MHRCKNRENTKAAEAKYKQLGNLHNGSMEISCTVFENIFCKFGIISRYTF